MIRIYDSQQSGLLSTGNIELFRATRMSRERTARKSLTLEGNLPQREQERSARMAGRHLPVALTFAEGLTAHHGIEAEP